MLVLSVLLVLVMIGSASAADEAGNETVSTSDSDVDTVSLEEDIVDDEVSAAEPAGYLVVNDTSKTDEKLGASNDEVLSESVKSFSQLSSDIASENVYGYYKYTGSQNNKGITITKSVDGHGSIIDEII